ncbi:MAG: metal ABC transporter permease [Deltaproteobacteria bacterium]|nr:metal ABC transporter permease [Deltaproteobacteria bacterium]
MLPAFAECLVLVGIHSYLGLHVIRRKVIFVDLALAQVAALGTTIGFLFGMAPDSTAALIFSMLFTFVGAAIFSITRLRGEKVPQEAVIGLVYALAAAVVILIVDRAPHGAEHIKEVMTGAILWVQWETIVLAAVVYGGVGLFHYVFRRQFLLISDRPEQAYAQGVKVRLWDFFFYLSFGVVISISVQTAGVLLVFVFLVVPAITATLITDRLIFQLAIGWSIGTLVSLFGLALSYFGDMPSGPTVVSFYGVMLVVVALFLFVFKAPTRTKALLKLAVGLAATAGIGVALFAIGHGLGQSRLAVGRAQKAVTSQTSQLPAQFDSQKSEQKVQVLNNASGLLRALTGKTEEQQEEILGSIDATHRDVLADAFQKTDDYSIRLAVARHIFVHDRARGACLLYETLLAAESPFIRGETISVIEELAGQAFEINIEKPVSTNSEKVTSLKAWLAETGCRRFDLKRGGESP